MVKYSFKISTFFPVTYKYNNIKYFGFKLKEFIITVIIMSAKCSVIIFHLSHCCIVQNTPEKIPEKYMGKGIKEWTKYNLLKAALRKFEAIWSSTNFTWSILQYLGPYKQRNISEKCLENVSN